MLSKVELSENLENIVDSARFLAELDVVEISFSSGHSLEVYVANTSQQKQRGLANLSAIDSSGMLFYYNIPTNAMYTMKDMLFDVEIAWYDGAGILLDIQHIEAGHESPVATSSAFNYVIEAPVGVLPFSDLVLNG